MWYVLLCVVCVLCCFGMGMLGVFVVLVVVSGGVMIVVLLFLVEDVLFLIGGIDWLLCWMFV